MELVFCQLGIGIGIESPGSGIESPRSGIESPGIGIEELELRNWNWVGIDIPVTMALAFMTFITNLISVASLYRSIRGIPNKVSHVLTVEKKQCRKIVRMQ